MKTDFVTIEEARDLDPRRAVVVVGVMRAFTTAAWAFHRGAARIVMFADLDEALAYKAMTPRALAFCDGAPKEGFDLFNSPGQLLDLDVTDRAIAQRTTAGTQGAVDASHADLILCTGFVTAAATARREQSTVGARSAEAIYRLRSLDRPQTPPGTAKTIGRRS